MRLYVLGPAFDLPSIDAECIAAVALLRSNVDEQWSIHPVHDISLRLPYLVTGDDERIHGFNNIARQLTTSSPRLSSTQRADSTALSSFLSSHAQTLLDISLYVSYENYATTRSAFTKILPWHANFIIPPRLRAAARKRTEHLGVSSIDVEDVHEDLMNRPQGFDTSVGKEKPFEAETRNRASLLLGRRDTVRGMLSKGKGGAVFKLHTLAENCLDVLQEMLGDKEYFLGTEQVTAVDFLVYGYLSLMLYPKLPQDWLGKILRRKYPALMKFVGNLHERLELRTDVDAVMALASCGTNDEAAARRSQMGMSLPWAPSAPTDPAAVATTIARDLWSRIPLVGTSTTVVTISPQKTPLWRTYLPAILLTATACLGSFGYYAFTSGLLVWPRGQEVHLFGRKRMSDYGHLGAALAGVSLLSQQATQARQGREQDDHLNIGPVAVEVEVDGESVP